MPVLNLDVHFWKPGWVESSDEEFDQAVTELIARDAWIMDGNYSRTLEARLARADVAVLLDPPTWQCLWGIYRRAIFRERDRFDLAEGCEEQTPDWEFVHYVLTYKWRSRPKVVQRIATVGVRYVYLPSRRAARRFLERVSLERGAARE